ncbi:MAG: iron-regulated protein [Rhizobiales bacterium]|nr:iron-regulated protein [Hyphomicrobiales bacterium]
MLKTWTALGVAVLAGAQTAQALTAKLSNAASPLLVQAQAEGGEGGEGGEGSGETPTIYALSSTDANAFNYDAKPQIAAYADLVHRSYAESKADADKLAAAIDALLDAPTPESLAAARDAWVKARPAYLRTETFRFYDGPIEAIEGEINAWPMNETFVDYVEGKPGAGLVNGKEPLNLATLTEANQKTDEADVTTGWHAIEFLLWGQDLSAEGPGNRPHADYVAGQGNNDRRRAYLKAAAEKLVGDLQKLEQAWALGANGNYRETFEKLEQREALGRIVNGMAVLAGFEFMSERLAVALDSGDQEDEHSCFSDTTKQDFVHDFEGIRRVWTETKLGELLASRDPRLAKAVDAAMTDAESRIAALGDPWDGVLAAAKDSPERQAAEAAVQSLQALANELKKAGNNLGVIVLIPTG